MFKLRFFPTSAQEAIIIIMSAKKSRPIQLTANKKATSISDGYAIKLYSMLRVRTRKHGAVRLLSTVA